MLSYVLIEFCIKIEFNIVIEGSNVAFDSMKIYFNLAYLQKFTPIGPEWVGRDGVGGKSDVKNQVKNLTSLN